MTPDCSCSFIRSPYSRSAFMSWPETSVHQHPDPAHLLRAVKNAACLAGNELALQGGQFPLQILLLGEHALDF